MCLKCKTRSTYIESKIVHGLPPKKFFQCANCGRKVQGVYNFDGTVHEFSTSKYKGGSNVVTLRLSDSQLHEFGETGKTSREIFELGLETYKNSIEHLAN